MENTLFFTLKVAVDVGDQPDKKDVHKSSNVHITMDIGPEFLVHSGSDVNRIHKRNFDFDAVQSILHFVSDELMEKIKAYVYTTYEKSVHEQAKAKAGKAEKKQADAGSRKMQREKAAIDLVKSLEDRQEKYKDGYSSERRINKITFQRTTMVPVVANSISKTAVSKMKALEAKAPGYTEKVTYSVESNGDLPPQEWPPKGDEEETQQ